MKYCIIGMPRSRSSMLLEAIKIVNNTQILGEDIGSIPLAEKKRQDYLNRLKILITKNNRIPQGVIRFHPLQMVTFNPISILPFELFNFKQYDKIYFTFRDSVSDNIASNFVAERLNKYTYKSKDEVVENIGTLTFTTDDYYNVDNYINSIKVVDSLKKYFLENNIASTDIEYNEIPEYVNKTYPAIVSHVETNYDYKKIISNYNDIIKVYEEKNI
jgi:hypothetical protein